MIATAIHSKSKDTFNFIGSLAALCDTFLQLHVIINFFDQQKIDPTAVIRYNGQNSSQLEGTWVPGMKTLFWKLHLTPERTEHLEAVWVFDCDIAVHPSVFPLGQLVGAMRATHATMLQPAIQAWIHGTYHYFLRVKKTHMSFCKTYSRSTKLLVSTMLAKALTYPYSVAVIAAWNAQPHQNG